MLCGRDISIAGADYRPLDGPDLDETDLICARCMKLAAVKPIAQRRAEANSMMVTRTDLLSKA